MAHNKAMNPLAAASRRPRVMASVIQARGRVIGMDKLGLPPRVADISDGKVTWEQLEAVDYDVLGYFLSCHLAVEHYLDEYLKVEYPALDWSAARHTFGQKVALLSRFKISDQYDCMPAIKHLNTVRNKLSHNLGRRLTSNDLLPLCRYLASAYGGKTEVPSDPREILSQFTTMTCVLFAGYISSKVHREGSTDE